MQDVAEFAQVSKMSVSRVFNNKPGVAEDTRQRIFDAIEQLGYEPTPDTSSSGNDFRLIGVLVPDISNFFFGEILNGVSKTAEKLNYGLVLYTQGLENNPQRNSHFISLVNTKLIDGVLLLIPRGYELFDNFLTESNVPHVIIGHQTMVEDEFSITVTNRKGMHEAVRHLLALGHRRIGFITGRMDIKCSHDRLDGYQDGLAEVGLPFEPELVLEGDYQQTSGFQNTCDLLAMENPPTAILASNDLMAFGAMDAAKTAGLTIGKDISIIGFDDIKLAAQSYPPLTTVRQPMATMGEAALDTLAMLLEGRTMLTPHRVLPTELIVRETTGHAP